MSNPISTLTIFGLKSGVSLYNLIESFNNHTKTVRDLKTDLKALDGVLKELNEVANHEFVANCSSLMLPLQSCGQICQEFDALIKRCADRTTDTRRSVRDWSKLELKSEEISAFRTSLSGYKSTIQIALGGVNLRTSQVTAECLQEYKDLIRDTQADLKEHLDRIEKQLAHGSSPPTASADYLAWATSQQRVEEEKASIASCLKICDEVSACIGRFQSTVFADVSAPADSRHDDVTTEQSTVLPSGRLTASRLSESVRLTRNELNERLSLIADKSSAKPPAEESVRQLLAMCETLLGEADRTRACTYEDISTDESSRQYIVSTIGDLISAKRVTAGPRSVIVLGQMSDESLQVSFRSLGPSINDSESSSQSHNSPTPSFEAYGTGHRLNNSAKVK